MNKKYIILIAISGTILVFFLFYNKKSDNYNEIFKNEIEIKDNINNIENISTEEEEKTIKVHITGEVNCQGIIELQEGGRIADAIEKAGGITNMADVTKINLAYVLEDGQKIYIPRIGEEIYNEVEDNSGENIIVNGEKKEGKININKASEEELQAITGVRSITS